MPAQTSKPVYHSNQYSMESACEHCEGVLRHQPWCITCNPVVRYAYSVVLDAERLTLADHIILHALGVSWKQIAFPEMCAATA